LEYDGRGFCGWQSQSGGCGVQDALEAALAQVAGSPVRVVAAGRTDTGVHARAQVVHFDVMVRRPLSAWIRGTNASLPPAVAVLWAKEVPEGFHARNCALARQYTYLLLNRESRGGLDHGRVGWFHRPLDIAAMRKAADALVGVHDFSAFRSSECRARTPVKDMREVAITREGDLIVIQFKASAFLHHMVRNIVGSLVYVGKGAHPPGWVAELLHGRDRTLAAPTFAAAGLYLSAVEYDRAWALPSPPPARFL
jgi:tRNA pseudouridine38-40 synthase